MSYPDVRLITTPEQVIAVNEAAHGDNHYVISPTHAIYKDGEVAGYWSLGIMPMVHLWHSTKHITPRDSLHLEKVMNAVMRERGMNKFTILCATESPYFKYAPKLGFVPLFNSNVMFKEV